MHFDMSRLKNMIRTILACTFSYMGPTTIFFQLWCIIAYLTAAAETFTTSKRYFALPYL